MSAGARAFRPPQHIDIGPHDAGLMLQPSQPDPSPGSPFRRVCVKVITKMSPGRAVYFQPQSGDLEPASNAFEYLQFKGEEATREMWASMLGRLSGASAPSEHPGAPAKTSVSMVRISRLSVADSI
jgi:hypothetical protein